MTASRGKLSERPLMFRRDCLGTFTSAMWYSVRKGVILKPQTSASMDLYAKSICKYNFTFQRVVQCIRAVIDCVIIPEVIALYSTLETH